MLWTWWNRRAGGQLDEVMDYLGHLSGGSHSKNVKSAHLPLVMIVMMVLVIGVLVVNVLPISSRYFCSWAVKCRFPLSVMHFGSLVGDIRRHCSVIAAWCGCLRDESHAGGKTALASFQSRFFLTRGNLYAKIASGRFAGSMAMMLSADWIRPVA
jgi:type II secretory pathway component PulF